MKKIQYIICLFQLVMLAFPHLAQAKESNDINKLKPEMISYLSAQCEKNIECMGQDNAQKSECLNASKELASLTIKQMLETKAVVTLAQIDLAKQCTAQIKKSSCDALIKELPQACKVWDSWDEQH